MRTYVVYIMAGYRGTLYIGVTNDLERRVAEHKQGVTGGFTTRYRVHKLVYYEMTGDVNSAIAREKQIKGWTHIKKVRLIEAMNQHWEDLGAHLAETANVE